jgi:hypothetical protein
MNKKRFSIKYLSLCLIGIFAVSLPYIPSEKERTADVITMQTAKKLKQEKDLCLIGTGGQMMNEIEMLDMGFQYFHEVNLEEARQLIVYAADVYLDAINKNEKIRPYLKNYPFTAKNLEIKIWVRKPDSSNVSPGNVHGIFLNDGLVEYEPQGSIKYEQPAPMLKESYEEAVQIVKVSKSVRGIQ